MQLYDRGIRRRLAPMLGDRRRMELAYSLLFALPGTPVLRYGEEIGMGDEPVAAGPRRRPHADAVVARAKRRLFGAERLVRPVISDGPFGYENVNVEDQLRDPHSFLCWMIGMIRVRHQAPEVGAGQWRTLPLRSPTVLGLRYDLDGAALITLHNLDAQPHDVSLPVEGRLLNLVDDETSNSRNDTHKLRLEPFGYRWYRARVARPKLGEMQADLGTDPRIPEPRAHVRFLSDLLVPPLRLNPRVRLRRSRVTPATLVPDPSGSRPNPPHS